MYLSQLLCNTTVVLFYIRMKGEDYDIALYFGLYKLPKRNEPLPDGVRKRKGIEVYYSTKIVFYIKTLILA